MTPESPAELDRLGPGLSGRFISAGHPDYESARRIHNGMIDRRPGLIARCASVSDVVHAVRLARRDGLTVSVRGGGHGVPGFAVCDGGLMIDLSGMRGVVVRPTDRLAQAEGGATWGDVDSATQEAGLATTGGVDRTTGIGGLTLAGGYGLLMRKYGLTCDNLRSAEVVTADGEVASASKDVNADLFWGLRGGGGNFGIVTSFDYYVHPVGIVYGGLVAWPIAQACKLMRAYDDFVADGPDELGCLFVLGTLPDGTKAAILLVCYCGREADATRCLGPLLAVGSPIIRNLSEMPYSAVQSIVEKFNLRGMRNYWKSCFLHSVPDNACEQLVDAFMMVPGPYTHIVLYTLGGAVARVPADATAVERRDARHSLLIVGMWEDSADDETNISYVQRLAERIRPFSSAGFYINFDSEIPLHAVRRAFGESKFRRLQQLKDKYDRSNFFRLNQNIPPTGHQSSFEAERAGQ